MSKSSNWADILSWNFNIKMGGATHTPIFTSHALSQFMTVGSNWLKKIKEQQLTKNVWEVKRMCG